MIQNIQNIHTAVVNSSLIGGIVKPSAAMDFFIMEIWKDIKGYEGIYQISNLANVRSLNRMVNSGNGANSKPITGILIKQIIGNGYKTVTLWKNNKCKSYRVHRLLLIAFIPNPENKPFVNHKDGNKLNNSIENLEWATRSENEAHALVNLLKKRRDGHSGNKLLEKDVIDIRSRYWYDGCKKSNARELAEEYGVCKDVIIKIIKRKLWSFI